MFLLQNKMSSYICKLFVLLQVVVHLSLLVSAKNVDGKDCDKLTDQCVACGYPKPVDCKCQNEGRCNNIDGSCRCPPQFSGVKCETRIKCDPPGVVADLIWEGNSFKVGDKISAKCQPNFALVGAKERTCSVDGTWIPAAPICKPVCPIPQSPNLEFLVNPGLNNQLLDADNKEVAEEIESQCDPPFTLIGPKRLRCQQNGKWDQEIPTCVLQTPCDDPGTPLKGSRIIKDDIEGEFVYGTSVKFACNRGFYLVGNETILCSPTGNWSSSIPQCQPVKFCPFLDSPDNGVVQLTPFEDESVVNVRAKRESEIEIIPQNVGLSPKSTAIYTCNESYGLLGSSKRECLPNGKWSGETPVCKILCGVKRTGSSDSDEAQSSHQWPWQVAIYRLNASLEWAFYCGGNLVNNKWVVTASHCLSDKSMRYPIEQSEYRVYLGKQFKNISTNDPEAVEYKIERFILHPNYHPKSWDSDVALIELSDFVTFTNHIHPVCLPPPITHLSPIASLEYDLPVGLKGVVTGWGEKINDTSKNTLKEFELPVVQRSYCEEKFRPQPKLNDTSVTSNMFCAGFAEGGSGTCTGYSGGPFVFPEHNVDHNVTQWVLQGIVSWGAEGCGREAHQYSVFVLVAHYVPWILSYIGAV